MATYYVWSGATGTNAGTSWTNAYTAFGSAVTAATLAGDIILVHSGHQENLAADTSYTFGADVRVISVNKDSSDTPTAMGTGGWIGHDSLNRAVTLAGARTVYLYGITLRVSGSTADVIQLNASDGQQVLLEDCYLWQGNTSNGGTIIFGNGSNGVLVAKNLTLRFGATGASVVVQGGKFIVEGGSISSAGSAPSTVFAGSNNNAEGNLITCSGFDFSHCTSSTLVGGLNIPSVFRFANCRLGSTMTPMATQTVSNLGSAEVFLFDCASGDTHGLFGYYNAFGQCVSNTGVYFTSGAAGQSWKIDTTSAAGFFTPFVTPWIDLYNTGTSSITPYLEILRDGSTTAYKADQVWAEFAAKTTTGTTLTGLSTDRATIAEELAGTAPDQAAGAGLGSWTGEGGSAWSGKCDSGSSITPAEAGHIRGRICVGAASATVYVDPQIRT